MGIVLSGKDVVSRMKDDMLERIAKLADEGVVPTIAIVRIGERPDDVSYERTAIKRAETLGINICPILLEEDVSEFELTVLLEKINADDSIHGCLLLRPFPRSIDEQNICSLLEPQKDIDGITPASLAGVFSDTGVGFAPATAKACLAMLDHYGYDLAGKHVVVVGRSLVIGKPVAMLCLARNASVTICHSKTEHLEDMMRLGDVVICATGRPRAFGASCFKEGQIVLDVGINIDSEGNLCGDVDFDEVVPIVAGITPVPGGMGTVTTSITMLHGVEAAERKVFLAKPRVRRL